MSGDPLPERPERLRVDARDYADWEAVYRDNVVRVYRLVLRRVGNPADAEDLTEEVMVRTLRTLRLPAPVRDVRSYLVKAVRSVLSEHWSHLHLDAAALDAEAAQLERVPQAVGDQARRVRELLARLSPRSRQVLELRFLERRSVREAAAALGVTEGHLKVLQFRALREAAALAAEVDDR